MKIDWNQKYTTIAVYTVLTALAILLLVTAVMYFPFIAGVIGRLNDILTPVWLGLVFAYLMNPILRFSETHIFRFKITTKRQKSLKRALSIILTFIIVLIILTVLALLILPQVYVSFMDLLTKLSSYISTTTKWLNELTAQLNLLLSESFFSELVGDDINNVSDLFAKLDLSRLTKWLESLVTEIPKLFSDNLPKVMDYFAGLANGFLDFILAVFFSVYFLASKEKLTAQLKKLLRSVTHKNLYNSILELATFTDKTFGGFFVGKIIDSLIIGILCYVVLAICQMPYALLISVIVGITNIIPVVGPIIGAIPGVFIIFIVDPGKALWFILIIIIIQQLDGNVIGPKILGQTTGISALWVLFSITVMGSLWGFLGMIVAVPIFAVIYSLVKIATEKRLAKRELPTATLDYYAGIEDRTLTDDESHTFAARLKHLSSQAAENPIGKRLSALGERIKAIGKKNK